MLAKTAKAGVTVQPNTETTIVTWVADGTSKILGFIGTGSYSAEFRLYVGTDPDPYYVYQTSPSLRTAYVADRASVVASGKTVTLKVYHESSVNEIFKGTILG